MKKLFSNGKRMAFLFIALLVIAIAFNKDYAKAADATITAINVKTGKETVTPENSHTGKITTEVNGYKTSIIEVSTDCPGLMYFDYKGDNTETINFTLFSDAAYTQRVASDYVKASTETVSTDNFTVPQAGTYYLELKSYGSLDIEYFISAYVISSDDSELADSESRFVSLTSYEDSNFYKITLKKAGAIKVFTTYANGEACYIDVDVYKKVDNKMKLLSEGDASAEGTVSGLGKGTYYIKLSKGSSKTYSIGYKFYSIADKSGSTKAKAGTLKIGKASEGLLLTTDKTSKVDWYKLKTTKKKASTITLLGEVTGGVTLEFIDSKGDSFGRLYISAYTKESSGSPYVGSFSDTEGKLPKGTYYLKVTKDKSDVSGYYSILVEQ